MNGMDGLHVWWHREITITNTVNFSPSRHGHAWVLLSTFPNLESLEFKLSHGSHALDLNIWPHHAIVFPSLLNLRIILRDVEDAIPVHTRRVLGANDIPQDIFNVMPDWAKEDDLVRSVGGNASVPFREQGKSSNFDDIDVEHYFVANLESSFPKLRSVHIRAGIAHYDEYVQQMDQPRGFTASQREVDLVVEVVRGLGGTYSCTPLQAFPKCRNLTVRALAEELRPYLLGEAFA